MKQHVDPASGEFDALTRVEQARIYHAEGWDIPSLMDEFCKSEQTIKLWLKRGDYERRMETVRRRSQELRARQPGEKAETIIPNWLETDEGKAAVASYLERRNKQRGS